MRKEIEELLKSDITAYRIFKETGFPYGNIDRLRNGSSSIDNITLKNAEKLYKFYLKTLIKKLDFTSYLACNINIRFRYLIF